MNNLNWNFTRRRHEKSHLEKKLDKIYDKWSTIEQFFSNFPIYTNLELNNLESIKKQLFDKSSILKFDLVDHNDFEIDCIIAIILILQCDGSSKIFKILDDSKEYMIGWAIEYYVEKLALNRDKKLINNLSNSAMITIENYISEQIIPLNTNRKEPNLYYKNIIKKWSKNKNLYFLWNDRESENIYWEGRKSAFYVLYLLDFNNLIQLIKKINNPYSYRMALDSIFDIISIDNWQYFVNGIESSTDENDEWNSNNLSLPLLIELAHRKIRYFESVYNLNLNSSQQEIDHAIKIINPIIEYVIDTLINKDKIILLRWVLFQFKVTRFNDIDKKLEEKTTIHLEMSNYIVSKIILDFCEKFDWNIHIFKEKTLANWNDKLPYEDWYIHTLLSISIYKKKYTLSPDNLKIVQDFFSKWKFSQKNWYEKEGNIFRSSLESFRYFEDNSLIQHHKYFFISYLLFISIKDDDSITSWKNLLISSDLFFDILKYKKYGDIESSCFNDYSTSRDALNTFCVIGLNLVIILAENNHRHLSFVYESVYHLLFRTLKSDLIPSNLYINCIKYLSFFRVYKLIRDIEPDPFTNTNPKLERYFSDLALQKTYLLDLINFLLLNKIDKTKFKEIVNSIPDFNINKYIQNIEELKKMKAKNYDINLSGMNEIKNLLFI